MERCAAATAALETPWTGPPPPPELERGTPFFVAFPAVAVGQSIPSRFAEVVARGPDRPAVVEAGRSATYAELDGRSNQVARALLERLGPGSEPVVVAVPDGIEAVAALLGVLKAGKIVCPLDASLPPARFGEVVAHAGARQVVVDAAAGRDTGLPPGATALELKEAARLEDGPVRVPIDPDAPAWLYYTSGSTGRPKGVVQSHRHQLLFIRHMTCLQRYNPEDRVGLLFPLSYLLSMWPLLAALCNGGSLHLWDMRRGGLAGVADWLGAHRITTLPMFPALFRDVVAAAGRPASFASLRYLALTIEPVSQADLALARRTLPEDAVLGIHFGSSEAFFVTWLAVSRSARIEGDPLPIGYPTGMTAIALLGEDGREVEDGAVGEMVVASRAMALGYWRDEALTRATFRPSDRGPGWIEYASGDLARRRPDGALEFRGRLARRLKIDGHTIEPAEVERALLTVAGVRQAHVCGRRRGGGNERLLAYVAADHARGPSAATIRAELARLLPAAMVPARIVVLERLPVTSRGKIDVAALPAPEADGDAPPRGELEAVLAREFAAALGVDAIGAETDFFAAGGSSLQALRLLAAVGRRVGRTLELPALLAAPTVRGLAAALGSDRGVGSGRLVALREDGSMTPLLGVWDGSGEVFSVRQVAAHLRRDRPVWAVRSPLLGGYRRPVASLEAMASDAIARLRPVCGGRPWAVAGYSFGGMLAFETARQLVEAGGEVPLLVIVDAQLSRVLRPTDHEAGLAGVARVVGELRRHRAALRHASWRQARAYVAERTRQRLALARLAVLLSVWGPAIRRGWRAPALLRAEHLVRVHGEVWRNHVARPYPGRTLLVVGSGDAAAEVHAWRPLLTGEVEIEAVASRHEDMIHEPAVGQVGRAVERVLARIEASSAEASTGLCP